MVRIGVAGQNETKLYLYENPNLFGEPLQVNATSGAEFNSSQTFRSYHFAGPTSWTVIGDVGSETCLRHTDYVGQNGYGFTYSLQENFQGITSILYGCDDSSDPNSTLTMPTTTTMAESTTYTMTTSTTLQTNSEETTTLTMSTIITTDTITSSTMITTVNTNSGNKCSIFDRGLILSFITIFYYFYMNVLIT
jgi:hypothetical protein